MVLNFINFVIGIVLLIHAGRKLHSYHSIAKNLDWTDIIIHYLVLYGLSFIIGITIAITISFFVTSRISDISILTGIITWVIWGLVAYGISYIIIKKSKKK